MSQPSLTLSVEVETPSDTFTLHPGDKAANKPTGINFGTERCVGFTTGGYALTRPIYRDYPDVGLLDTHRFIGDNGDVAYEGQLHSNPRSNDPAQQLKMSLTGFAAVLSRVIASNLIIDRRLEGWGDPSMQRRANLITAGFSFEATSMNIGRQSSGSMAPGVSIDFGSVNKTVQEIGEAWKWAGGEEIAALRYDFATNNTGNSDYADSAGLAETDVGGGLQVGTDHNATSASSQSVNATKGGKEWALFSSTYTGTAEGDGSEYHAWLNPRIIGYHGLTAIGSEPNEGYGLTDIMQFLLQQHTPSIGWAGQENNFSLQQATWHDSPATLKQIIDYLNDLVLWETNVWEGPALHFHAADLTEPDWIVRSDDPGVSVEFAGDSIENFANGIVVTFTDLLTGQRKTLHPEDYSILRDDSEDNPANRHNEKLYTSWDVPFPCFEGEALQQGAASLAEFNRPKRPGTIRISGGYIKDAAGHWQQGWKVRSSQSIAVMDIFDDRPRLITSTNWDQESLTLSLTLDVPPPNLDLYVARRAVAAAARNQ